MSENHLQEPWVAADGGRTVVLRAVRRGEADERKMVETPEMRLDLQGPIDNLRSVIGDLEAYYWERSGRGDERESERCQIRLWIRQINERTAVLLDILLQLRSRTVVVTGIGPADRDALESAATVLDRWIREDEPFHDVMCHVGAILNAVDRIALTAAGGRPDDSQ